MDHNQGQLQVALIEYPVCELFPFTIPDAEPDATSPSAVAGTVAVLSRLNICASIEGRGQHQKGSAKLSTGLVC